MTHEAYNGNGNGGVYGHRNGTSPSDLRRLYARQLVDVRQAEHHSARALPDMAVVASDEHVASTFRAAASETEVQLARLDRLIRALNLSDDERDVPELDGLLARMRTILDGEFDGDAQDLDTALLSSAREALRYQIAGYEAACATARRLGDYRTLDVLLQSLDEELSTESSFSRLMSRHGRLLRAN